MGMFPWEKLQILPWNETLYDSSSWCKRQHRQLVNAENACRNLRQTSEIRAPWVQLASCNAVFSGKAEKRVMTTSWRMTSHMMRASPWLGTAIAPGFSIFVLVPDV